MTKPAQSRSQTAALLKVLRSKRPPSIPLVPLVLVCVGAFITGAVAAPATITPQTHGGVTHWGGWPLESAFTGCVLIAAIATFRVFEILYRSHDAAALRMLPLSGGAVGFDRLTASIKETVAGNLVVVAFVSAALIRPGGLEAWLCTLGFVAVASLVVPMVGFGVVVSAGVASLNPGTSTQSASRDTAAHFAPGAAFGAAAALLLLAKLGAEDPLRAAADGPLEFTRATWFGLGVPLIGAAAFAMHALRAYGIHHHGLQARFIDAESHRVETTLAYFQEGAQPLSRMESRLGPVSAMLYRKDRLQLARSAPFLRVGTWLVAAIAIFVAWGGRGSLSPIALGLVLAAWLAVVIAPYRRLLRLPGEATHGFSDMLASSAQQRVGRAHASAHETLVQTLPIAFVGFAAGLQSGMTVAAIVVASAAGIVFAGGSPHAKDEWFRMACSALAVALVIVAATASPVAGLAIAVVIAALSAGSLFRTRPPRTA